MAKGYNRPMGVPSQGGGGMMQQLKKMQEQLAAAQDQLAQETVTASVGGGAVTITMTGDQHCTAVTIRPEVLADPDAEMIQDLILSAVNAALDQTRDLASERMGPVSGGLNGLGF